MHGMTLIRIICRQQLDCLQKPLLFAFGVKSRNQLTINIPREKPGFECAKGRQRFKELVSKVIDHDAMVQVGDEIWIPANAMHRLGRLEASTRARA